MATISSHDSADEQHEINMNQGDMHRVTTTAKQIQVKSGTAYITYEGKDIFLNTGESFVLEPGKHDAIVTAATKKTLIMEVIKLD